MDKMIGLDLDLVYFFVYYPIIANFNHMRGLAEAEGYFIIQNKIAAREAALVNCL